MRSSLYENLLPHPMVADERTEHSRASTIAAVMRNIHSLYQAYREDQAFERRNLANDQTVKNALKSGERSLQVILLLLFRRHIRAGESEQIFIETCQNNHSKYSRACQSMDLLIKIDENENNMAAMFSWLKLGCFLILMILPYIWQWLNRLFVSSMEESELIYNPDFVTGSFVVQFISCITLFRRLKFVNILAMIIIIALFLKTHFDISSIVSCCTSLVLDVLYVIY